MISLLPQPTCFFKVSGDPVYLMMDYNLLGHIFKEGAKTNGGYHSLALSGVRDQHVQYRQVGGRPIHEIFAPSFQNTILFPIKCLG